MRSQSASYHGYRFPPDTISHAVWLYYGFCLSFRDAGHFLAQRSMTVPYETIRQSCQRFGPVYARRLRRRRDRMKDSSHFDEVFVTIQGRQQYLWRAGTGSASTDAGPRRALTGRPSRAGSVPAERLRSGSTCGTSAALSIGDGSSPTPVARPYRTRKRPRRVPKVTSSIRRRRLPT